ncbi:alcohol dehydrogenase superfamily, zinc-containing [Purpureocillium lavendulum]|uniref:Alcohol dehydrogenase superfamily, zinc-containing n=1 Tax=Purpureocillium lavendulum TaxID=1247861 RepID=A0AB34G0Z9_9HYPO|nr:alcohol dehydrogenase superfamily, zinc-containing [Purpureocillium lavendulum]
MQLKPLAFAAAAAAMLIVPETSEAGEDIFKALPIQADTLAVPTSALSQTVKVPCSQCKGKDSQLKLDFNVEGGSRLMLNGFELYPTADPWNGDLSAVVAQANGQEKEQRLGYSLSIEPEAVDLDLHLQLINTELRVIEVGSRFVEGVPTVKVQLIKAADGEIAIANVALIDSPVSGCSTMLCRARQQVEEMLRTLKGFKGKGCGRHRNKGHPHHPGAKHNGDAHGSGVAPPHGGRPHHRPHPPHHHLRPHHHDWRKLMKNVASHIFLPVLMGITAGVGVAVCAMVLCSVIVKVTRLATCRRAGARCCRRRQSVPRQDSDIEKVGLMEESHEEPPPQYRDDESK